MGEIKSDLDRFLRKIRLTLYLPREISEDDTIASTPPNLAKQCISEFEDKLIRKFRNKSNWTPKKQDVTVETPIKTIVTDFQKLEPRRRPQNNLTKDERQRLKHIVIKPADKGSAIVIMNRTDYITEATRQLPDMDFYIKILTDLTEDHKTKISKTLNIMLRNDEIA